MRRSGVRGSATEEWAVRDPLLRSTDDPGFVVPPPVRSLARLMNGRRTTEQIAALGSWLIGRPVTPAQVARLVQEFDDLGFLDSDSFRVKIGHLAETVGQSEWLDHSWLDLYREWDGLQIDSCVGTTGSQCPVAVMVPHVGSPVSYAMSRTGISMLASETNAELIVVIGPNHVAPQVPGAVLTLKGFDTPLGRIPVDADAAKELSASDPDLFRISDIIHRQEHCIAMQAPFIVDSFPPGVVLLPVVVSAPSAWSYRSVALRVADRIREGLRSRRYTVLVTGDLFHNVPGRVQAWKASWSWRLRAFARRIYADPQAGVQAMDAQLLTALERGRIESYVSIGTARRDCAPLPLWVAWQLVQAVVARSIVYNLIGSPDPQQSGVSAAVLVLRRQP